LERSRVAPRANEPRRPGARVPGNRINGQSLIESCLAIFLIALVFTGVYQVSQVFAAREILHHAASRGVRAKTVGFDWWMVEKSIRVAAIPNAGRMTIPAWDPADVDPDLQNAVRDNVPGEVWDWVLSRAPSSRQFDIEIARIPEYLVDYGGGLDNYILDYAEWPTVLGDHDQRTFSGPSMNPNLWVTVEQKFPLRVPFHRAFWGADQVKMKAKVEMEGHYPLYLDDRFW
jgi:hypothetical protein